MNTLKIDAPKECHARVKDNGSTLEVTVDGVVVLLVTNAECLGFRFPEPPGWEGPPPKIYGAAEVKAIKADAPTPPPYQGN